MSTALVNRNRRHFISSVTTFEELIAAVPPPLHPYGKVTDSCGNLLSYVDARSVLRDRAKGVKQLHSSGGDR